MLLDILSSDDAVGKCSNLVGSWNQTCVCPSIVFTSLLGLQLLRCLFSGQSFHVCAPWCLRHGCSPLLLLLSLFLFRRFLSSLLECDFCSRLTLCFKLKKLMTFVTIRFPYRLPFWFSLRLFPFPGFLSLHREKLLFVIVPSVTRLQYLYCILKLRRTGGHPSFWSEMSFTMHLWSQRIPAHWISPSPTLGGHVLWVMNWYYSKWHFFVWSANITRPKHLSTCSQPLSLLIEMAVRVSEHFTLIVATVATATVRGETQKLPVG